MKGIPMDGVASSALRKYRESLAERDRQANHRITRNTIISDDEDGNTILIELFEELMAEPVHRTKHPLRALKQAITLTFYPDRFDGERQNFVFPDGVVVTRESKQPPGFTVTGRIDGREVRLVVQRKQGRYTLVLRRVVGSGSGSVAIHRRAPSGRVMARPMNGHQ